jgi:hypothetical protein
MPDKICLTDVIGLVGATGAGKTVLAERLAPTLGYTRLSMAEPLKEMLLALGLTQTDVNGPPAQRARSHVLLGGKSPRFALQTLGTDWGRNRISPDIWANAVYDRILRKQETARELGQEHAGVIIDDLRFPNDWAMLNRLGGVLIRIRRPGIERARTWLDRTYYRWPIGPCRYAARLFGWRPIHETEYHWPDAPADAEFWNTGTPEELLAQAIAYLRPV